MNLVHLWRELNFVLAFISLVWLLIDLKKIYLKLSHRRIYLTFSLAGFLLATLIGSVWNILTNHPPFIQTGIITAACIWCILGLWISRNEVE